ncbi:histone-like nucleoid-structuring protein Lsr2 [Arthrobacter bambusae]|uniref:Lsr2 family protein n=1 Tax=Arthrobacter bambusae TaxID=1338426 RepID=A0AAW8DHS5_9MICC|nr:Lsr2 family protein [Arthrobacter bambusae]MDP9904724.1 hypothetical protein [Arthrobacter bambusae]MDQ0129540.1 hypothetical protein [Arthrobacter bambusae]MDQ0180847.1 hypothetical protein [Arthrobacter bambusae]
MKKVIESDLSGRQDAERVTFGLGDTWYEIDLTDDERQGLEAALKSYLDAGRIAVQEPPKPRKMVPTTTPEEREKIREWGRKNGFDFAPYGRIPKEVMAAYDAAHKIKRTM